METSRKLPPLARLVQALQKAGIRFQIAGMSAAILQGVPATTLDTDIWVELPERSFVKLTDIVLKQDGIMLAPTVAALSDDSLVNFLPRVDGVLGFAAEFKRAPKLAWHGMKVPVLHLKSILASKQHLGRNKDLAHLPLIEQTIRLTDPKAGRGEEKAEKLKS